MYKWIIFLSHGFLLIILISGCVSLTYEGIQENYPIGLDYDIEHISEEGIKYRVNIDKHKFGRYYIAFLDKIRIYDCYIEVFDDRGNLIDVVNEKNSSYEVKYSSKTIKKINSSVLLIKIRIYNENNNTREMKYSNFPLENELYFQIVKVVEHNHSYFEDEEYLLLYIDNKGYSGRSYNSRDFYDYEKGSLLEIVTFPVNRKAVIDIIDCDSIEFDYFDFNVKIDYASISVIQSFIKNYYFMTMDEMDAIYHSKNN